METKVPLLKKSSLNKSDTKPHLSTYSNKSNSSILNQYQQHKLSSAFSPKNQSKSNINYQSMQTHHPTTISNQIEPQNQSTQQQNDKNCNVQVYARFRPYDATEQQLLSQNIGKQEIQYLNSSTISINNSTISLDQIFNPNTTQEEIYNQVAKESILNVLNGYNGTIFAYGQTGSGKTYTIYGDISKQVNYGIIPRSITDIFDYIQDSPPENKFILECSFIEIYKENIFDLLNLSKQDLKIKESTKGIYVEGLKKINATSAEELFQVVELAESTRKVASTKINQYSSRSHTIFVIEIVQITDRIEKKGTLNLVDLAGSEKVAKTHAEGNLLDEAKKINFSLSCLGKVINALTTNQDHVPYRDSKLTRLLQESLGGNYRTSLIVNCTQHSYNIEESISTLKFAQRAKNIKNKLKVNITQNDQNLQQIINDLKQELSFVKSLLGKQTDSSFIEIAKEPQSNSEKYDSSLLTNYQKSNFKKMDQDTSSHTQKIVSIDLSQISPRNQSSSLASNPITCFESVNRLTSNSSPNRPLLEKAKQDMDNQQIMIHNQQLKSELEFLTQQNEIKDKLLKDTENILKNNIYDSLQSSLKQIVECLNNNDAQILISTIFKEQKKSIDNNVIGLLKIIEFQFNKNNFLKDLTISQEKFMTSLRQNQERFSKQINQLKIKVDEIEFEKIKKLRSLYTQICIQGSNKKLLIPIKKSSETVNLNTIYKQSLIKQIQEAALENLEKAILQKSYLSFEVLKTTIQEQLESSFINSISIENKLATCFDNQNINKELQTEKIKNKILDDEIKEAKNKIQILQDDIEIFQQQIISLELTLEATLKNKQSILTSKENNLNIDNLSKRKDIKSEKQISNRVMKDFNSPSKVFSFNYQEQLLSIQKVLDFEETDK